MQTLGFKLNAQYPRHCSPRRVHLSRLGVSGHARPIDGNYRKRSYNAERAPPRHRLIFEGSRETSCLATVIETYHRDRTVAYFTDAATRDALDEILESEVPRGALGGRFLRGSADDAELNDAYFVREQ